MKIELTSWISVGEMWISRRYITWFIAKIIVGDDDSEEPEEQIGTGRFALIHVGEAGASLYEALDADSADLESIYDVYFTDDWFKDEFTDGVGCDLLYIDDIEIIPAHQGKNIEFAVMDRLCSTLGKGCVLAVVSGESTNDMQHWTQMGFEVSTPGEDAGLMHIKLAFKRPRVVGPDEGGRFKVVPNLSPEQRRLHH